MTAHGWCFVCGTPYVREENAQGATLLLPACECAGDPPVARGTDEWLMHLGRVHALHFTPVREPATTSSLAEDFDSVKTRGGVRFMVDGEWREVRFTAHPLRGSDLGELREYACMSVDEVALLLRATEIASRR